MLKGLKHHASSIDLIRKLKDRISWNLISRDYKLSEDFIREFKDRVDWYWISMHQKLSENFIKEFQDKVDWNWISMIQKLSEDFIREFKDRVNWNYISIYQKLSENFIREFQNRVDWDYISTYQILSEEFIREFEDRVNWNYIAKHQILSESFIKEFNLKIDKITNWNYVSNDVKLKAIKDSGLYEIVDDDYVIAYKGIRSDNYSKFNFQYHYLVGNTYESHCNANIDKEISFGLSAWTFEKAKEYCDEKVIKVKIHINDVKALINNSNKIRCSKFEVIEEVSN